MIVLALCLLAAPERIVLGLEGDLLDAVGNKTVAEVVALLDAVEVRRLHRALVVDGPTLDRARMLLKGRRDVRWVEREVFFEVAWREAPADPRYAEQWHLHASDAAQADTHINAEAAWATTLGEGSTVAVVDDGFDLQHADLVERFAAGIDLSAADGISDDDPSYESTDVHGTQTAGVIAASMNGVDVVGVCPECTLVPVRLIGGGGPPTLYSSGSAAAAAIEFAVDAGSDVINNSWGPEDGNAMDYDHPATLWPKAKDDRPAGVLPTVLTEALTYAVRDGRGGKGCVVTWAAGNGNELVTYDRVASDARVLAIGSVDASGRRAYYSDYGPTLFAVTPSSGDDLPEIVTTDISGAAGKDTGDVTDGFGGTSASTAMAAGIAALVIAAYPELTAAQVIEALAAGAYAIDAGYANYVDGRSQLYGFGRLDAAGALAAAALYDGNCTLSLELCGNDSDDDCDGATDENCTTCIPDSASELCDGLDNDCDGAVDEDYVCVTSDRPMCAPCDSSSECEAGLTCRSGLPFGAHWCLASCDSQTPCAAGFECSSGVCQLVVTDAVRDCRDVDQNTTVPEDNATCDGQDPACGSKMTPSVKDDGCNCAAGLAPLPVWVMRRRRRR